MIDGQQEMIPSLEGWRTSDVVKVDVQITNVLLEIVIEVRTLVVESLVDTQFPFQPPALVITSCNGVYFGTSRFTKLASD